MNFNNTFVIPSTCGHYGVMWLIIYDDELNFFIYLFYDIYFYFNVKPNRADTTLVAVVQRTLTINQKEN